jgi:hypothetical protein
MAAVDPEDLRRAITVIEMMGGLGDVESVSIAVAAEFAGEGGKAAPVMLRLEALDRLTGDPRMRAWTMPTGEAGSSFICGPLIEAAAVHPLRIEDDRPVFEPDSFFDRVLRLAEAAGGTQ